MFRTALVNMPFASLKFPSLALTQLDSALEKRIGHTITREVLYLNHDFARRIGAKRYQYIAVDMEAPYNGLGDWFFRQAAFPNLEDNTDVYFQRFFPQRTEETAELKSFITKKRKDIDGFLEEVIDEYALDKADLVGFTSMFSQNAACFALARRIKERNPEGLIVMGGANCETPMGDEIVKNIDAIDYVFSGNSLKSFPDFVQACLKGERANLTRIRGVIGNNGANGGGADAPTGQELPLDVPIELNYQPFLDAVEKNFGKDDIQPILLFETSRGCWWGEKAHCTFCGLNGTTMNYRSMSSSRARSQIQSLFKYSDRVSRIQSVDNIMPRHYPKEVFAGLETPEHMTIFYEVKADLGEEDMELLARAGVREVQPGIEALATSTLKLMRKGTTVFQNLRFLKHCLTFGIFPDWSVLIGFPGESEEVYEKYVRDIPSLTHLPPPSGAYPMRPDRYSPYHVRAEEYGLALQPTDFYELVYPFDRETLNNLAYFFRDFNFGADYFDAMVRWFEQVRESVDRWRERWEGKDGTPPPMLHFEKAGDPTLIYDSRHGAPRHHRIGESGGKILERLALPHRIDKIETAFAELTARDREQALSELVACNLLFREGDQIMSLVLPSERAPHAHMEHGWSWAL